MVRTKGQIRSAKSKGAQFEMDTEASLQQIYPECYRTHERGYVMQYDLRDDECEIVYECKFHKSMPWNKAKKYFLKLESLAPEDYESVLIYKSNQQPVLIMYRHWTKIKVCEFEQHYGVPFIKHKPIKRGIKK